MKKVLLIGDSIRMSYQETVAKNLDGLAEVISPEENCRFAKYTLWEIGSWANNKGIPDIVHWNNGIWDIFHPGHCRDSLPLTDLENYLIEMNRILKYLKQSKMTLL